MFYYVAKIAWYLANPVTVLGLLTLVLGIACFLPWPRLRRGLAGIGVVYLLVIMTVPIGGYLGRALEDRFPANPVLPEHVDGIVVLGGAVDPAMTEARGQFAVNGSFDRVLMFARLADRFPTAKLVYTGGSHDWTAGIGEADVMAPLLKRLGVDSSRVVFEGKSRNTFQNASRTRAIVKPGASETWVVITSGYHMPRAIGCFRRAGWPRNLIAYPVDFHYRPNTYPVWFTFDINGGLGTLGRALHEWLGLVGYYLSDRTDSLFPGPEAAK